MGVGHRGRRRSPDAPKAGDHVEGFVVPRKGLHVADTDVAVRVAIPRHRDQALRRVDARAHRAAESGQFNGQPRAARDIEDAIAVADAEVLVHRDVLAAMSRLQQRRELNGPTPPALVHHLPRHSAPSHPM